MACAVRVGLSAAVCLMATSVLAQQPLVITPVPIPEPQARTAPPPPKRVEATAPHRKVDLRTRVEGTSAPAPRTQSHRQESGAVSNQKPVKPYPGLFSWDDHQ
jgi:hypothetical protein